MTAANALLSSQYFHNVDRQRAVTLLIERDEPILRPSSMSGHYAVTLKYKNKITHFLLKAASEKIEVVADNVVQCAFASFPEFLSFIRASHYSRVSDPIPP